MFIVVMLSKIKNKTI